MPPAPCSMGSMITAATVSARCSSWASERMQAVHLTRLSLKAERALEAVQGASARRTGKSNGVNAAVKTDSALADMAPTVSP